MKVADLPGLTATVPPAARNGTHPAEKNGRAQKRSAGAGARAQARLLPPPIDTTFVAIEAEPIDAPTWPLHSALWLQPDVAPSVAVWTGLGIERRNQIPAPGFLDSDMVPANRPGILNSSQHTLTPGARQELPQSGLEPLGWDPRALCRKERSE